MTIRLLNVTQDGEKRVNVKRKGVPLRLISVPEKEKNWWNAERENGEKGNRSRSVREVRN
jgi:hypothetical protein